MALIVGTNSYVTVQEADDYLADRYGTEAWDTEPNKEGALISAADILDGLCSWYGVKIDPDQTMAFPRTDADPVPDAIKHGQIEIAFSIVSTGSTSASSGDPLEELQAGSVMLKFKASAQGHQLINEVTSSLLSMYGRCGGFGSTKIIPIERS